jgi:hypothetical protein
MTARQKSLTAAAKRSVAALRKAGSLEAVDEIKVQTLLYTSDQLDNMHPEASPAMVASMTRAHLAACRAVFDQEPTGDDNGVGELLAALATMPAGGPMGDAPEAG